MHTNVLVLPVCPFNCGKHLYWSAQLSNTDVCFNVSKVEFPRLQQTTSALARCLVWADEAATEAER